MGAGIKVLFILILLPLFGQGFSLADEIDPEATDHLITNPDPAWANILALLPARTDNLKVQRSREIALTLLDRAATEALNSHPSDTLDLFKIFSDASQILREASILEPYPAINFGGCVKNRRILAYVITTHENFRNLIFLCATSLDLRKKSLAQVLIHEVIHLAGILDECQTTQAEVSAMELSGEGLAFKNGYMQKCGIR